MNENDTSTSKSAERKAFIFVTVFLAPLVAIALVGSYGLAIWVYQMLAGPPTGG